MSPVLSGARELNQHGLVFIWPFRHGESTAVQSSVRSGISVGF